MATAQRPTSGGAVTQEIDPARLLDQIINRQQGKAYETCNNWLTQNIAKVEELLPDGMKDQAARLVKRAMLTFSKNKNLQQCTPASFVSCVLQAAECGLAIDGRLAHAVPYKDVATFQPDYKGLIAVAKRTGQIIDIYGDVICENDTFAHGRAGDTCRLEHTFDITQERGKPVGAYQIIVLPGGRWRYEVMSVADIKKVQNRSKSGNSGPWGTDWSEMAKKTVAKRALKLYSDDPGLLKALEYDDQDYEDELPKSNASKVGRSAINDALQVPVAAKASAFAEQPKWPAQDDDPFRGQQSPQDAAEGVDDEPADDGNQDAGDPLAGLHEALAACKSKQDCQAVAKRFYKPGLSEDQINEVSAACDEKSDTLPDAAKGKQKTAFD